MIKNLRVILDSKSQKLVTIIFIGLIFSGILEMIGIGILPSLVLAIDNTENFLSRITYLPLNDYLSSLTKEKLLIIICSTVFVIFLIKNILLFILIIFENYIMRNLRVNLSKKLMNKYLSNPYSFFIDRNTSIFLRNLQNEIGNSTNYISAFLILAREILVVSFLLSLLLYKSTKITLIVFSLFGLITLILYYVFKNKTSKVSKRSLFLREKIFKIINEFLTSIKDVKIFGAENYVLQKYTKDQKELSNTDFYIKNLNSFPRLLLEIVSIGSILLFCIFFIASASFEELLPNLTLLIILLVRFLPAFSLINQSLYRLRVLRVSLDLISNELKSDINITDKNFNSKKKKITFFKEEIKLDNVSFQYQETKKKILNNISLKIKKGEFIGIIGESGSGKTTLINLICGLINPDSGSIYFDQKNISQYSLNSLIGYVPQDIYLLQESIKKNIAFGKIDEEISSDKINNAIKISNLKNFINEKNFKLDSNVGSLGIKLSGGQKQRIGIARAIYKNSPILILDESTSSLDTETESRLIEEIKKLKDNLTIIFVSHRMSALKNCDKIYKLENGLLHNQ